MVLQKENAGSQNEGGVPPYRKLTLAEAFDIATISNALGSSMQAGAARRIPVRLRVSRRAALVALVGSGWENEWSRVVRFACNACSWGSKRLSS